MKDEMIQCCGQETKIIPFGNGIVWICSICLKIVKNSHSHQIVTGDSRVSSDSPDYSKKYC
jgi:hypothetical protein